MIHVHAEVEKNIKGVMETNNKTWYENNINSSDEKIQDRDVIRVFHQSVINGNNWVKELLNVIKY